MLLSLLILPMALAGQPQTDLTLDRLFSQEFAESDAGRRGEWLPDGKSLLAQEPSKRDKALMDIVRIDAASGRSRVIVHAEQLMPAGQKPKAVRPERLWLSSDGNRLLIFANSSRVWRQNTKGDYYVFDIARGHLSQVGPGLNTSSLMFAKLSPDGTQVGFVYKNNLYAQDIASGRVTQLTADGTDTLVNGTFDWVYEEELDLRDGWRWSPDGKSIAYWQLDSSAEPLYTLINDTDALYPTVKRFPYPKAGQTNASARIGVVPATGGETTWIDKTATSASGYLARMDWAANSDELIVESLNRLQNRNEYLLADAHTGKTRVVFTDSDPSWVDMQDTGPNGVRWIEGGKSFLAMSEHEGWRRLYKVSRDGSTVLTLTPGKFDVKDIAAFDAARGVVYFNASPENSTQGYLYQASIADPNPQRVTPASQPGANDYDVSPTGALAYHTHSRFGIPPNSDIVSLPGHKIVRKLGDNAPLKAKLAKVRLGKTQMINLIAADGEIMDASIITPPGFDRHKRYPVFFEVYGEPAGTTVHDSWGGFGYLFQQMLAEKGYIVMSVDNRGTPALKGRAWRKSVYKKVGPVSAADQAAAVKQIDTWPFVDPKRIGIWGWSGGGSSTLHALFRYPDLYRLGMAVAPVPDERLYDTIYQERYMGLPQDSPETYKLCSAITYAKQLKGHLLIVHGSGDDNVHYQGTERLVNELVAHNKPFQLMVYPNRSHGIFEGPGTTRHVYELLVRFLTTNMPPGPRR